MELGAPQVEYLVEPLEDPVPRPDDDDLEAAREEENVAAPA